MADTYEMWLLKQVEKIKEEARAEERKRIADWVEEHRSGIEYEPGVVIYRDHFDSDLLLDFINGTVDEDSSLD